MRWIVIGFLSAVMYVQDARPADSEDQQKINLAVEALTRLESGSLEEKSSVKATVNRVLDKTRGTPGFVRLVQHFKLTNQTAGLLEVAINHPKDESGVEAMRLVLACQDFAPVKEALQTTNLANVVPLVEVLGNAREKQAVPLVEPLGTDETSNTEVRRAAVRALAQTQDGAASLLALARQGMLPGNLQFIAASELNGARWPDIKAEAAKLLPLPAGQNSEPLPPLTELVKMKGEAAKGAEVFRRETTGCIKCHQVRGEGRDLGPDLSEIGTKLSKEALYESILDPSAGISFGFEAWQVQLKSGDEAYGLIQSETADEVAVKALGGIVTRYKKSEIERREQLKLSIMPAGLQQAMTVQELVDLVEYLASLKK